MKNLIIAGRYTSKRILDNSQGFNIYSYILSYEVNLYGQTFEHPKMICFKTSFKFESTNYNQTIENCINEYCKYFEVDDFNIITLENFIKVDSFDYNF
jgi:hypothetical protein